MRIPALLLLLLPAVMPRDLLRRHKHVDTHTSSCGMTAILASFPTLSYPSASLSDKLEGPELHQAPGLVPIKGIPAVPANTTVSELGPATPLPIPVIQAPAPTNPVDPATAPLNPIAPPAVNPRIAVPPPAPIAPIIPRAMAPAVTTLITTITSTRLASPGVSGDFVTTQWVETWIGGTSQTWIPKTITFHFAAIQTSIPPPGRGEIGMGSLTGETGKTQTIIMGNAPSQSAQWKKGVAAAIGAGVIGMVV